MLSIGKLAVGQSDYYLEQARAGSPARAQLARTWRTTTSAALKPPACGSAAASARSGCAAPWGARAGAERRAPREWNAARPRGAWPCPGLRSDVLRAEERLGAVRRRQRRLAVRDPGRARPCGARCARVCRARGRRHAARPWRRARHRGTGAHRGGVPASQAACRRSPATHARAGREPGARRRRSLVDARRPSHLRARQDRRLPLRGAAAVAADARARGGVWSGPRWDRRHRGRAGSGAAGVQPAMRGHRGGDGAARLDERRRGAGGGAGNSAREGLRRHTRAAGPGVAPPRPTNSDWIVRRFSSCSDERGRRPSRSRRSLVASPARPD